MNKKLIIPIILTLFVIAGGVFWWWQSGKEEEKSPAGLPEGIEYTTPETGIIEGVVKPAPFNTEDVVVDPETGIQIIKDEIGILFKDNISEEERNEIIASINGEIVGYGLSGQSCEVKIKGNPTIADLKNIIKGLEKNPKIEIAKLSTVGLIQPKRVPDSGKDPQWKDTWNENKPGGKNWGLEAVYAPSAWDYNDSIKSVRMGIVDVGFKFNHEDLKISMSQTNFNYLEGVDELNKKLLSSDSKKECVIDKENAKTHGTHVTGIIGALSNNEVGITGVVWNRDLFIYEPNLKDINILEGVEWLLNQGTKIINLSWGWDAICSPEEEIRGGQNYYNKYVKQLIKNYDFLIIQGAGNSGIDAEKEVLFNFQLDELKYKELKKRIVTVGAIENDNGNYKMAWFGKDKHGRAYSSNYGDLVDVVAPGKEIYTTFWEEDDDVPWWKFWDVCFDRWNNSYGCSLGTSMAAPFVTGVAGLVLGADPDLTAEQVKAIIVNSADRPIVYEGREYKILNAKPAVKTAYELVGEAIVSPQAPFPEEEVKKEIPEIIEKGGPAALVPPSVIEEKPREEEKKEPEKTEFKIIGFVKDQHNEPVKNADFWLIDIQGKKYGSGETSLTGYLEIDTKSIPEGNYTLHIEKVDWQGLTKIPYCDPYEKEISITKKGIDLGIITVRKWSKITARVVDESGSFIDGSMPGYAFNVIDKEGHSPNYYPTYPSHWGYFNQYGKLETHPLPDGEYTLEIYYIDYMGKKTLTSKEVKISGNDVSLGEIIIQ